MSAGLLPWEMVCQADRSVPGAAPSSITCSFDVRFPLAMVFCAKLMTVLAAAAPGACTAELTVTPHDRYPRGALQHALTRRCREACANHASQTAPSMDMTAITLYGTQRAAAVRRTPYKHALVACLDGGEGCSMCLQSLAALLLHRVQLHVSLHQVWPAQT